MSHAIMATSTMAQAADLRCAGATASISTRAMVSPSGRARTPPQWLPRGGCPTAMFGRRSNRQTQARTRGKCSMAAARQPEDDETPGDKAPSVAELLELMQRKQQGKQQGVPLNAGEGEVWLVGTGPGDPSLLTLKALQLMQTAQVVLYDRLVSNDILDMVGDQALMVYVGKRSGYHHKTQDEINNLILQYAQAGSTVLRLKGGDPNVFGRGGEEMEFLREHDVSVRTVPGITAAAGITAELQIPLTCRTVANSATFLTGHSRVGGEDPLEEIAARADERTTMVIYMGLAALPELAARLQEQGLPGSIPAVAVMKGTTKDQVSVFASMEALPEAVKRAELKSPTLVVIGHVVAMSPLYPGHGKEAVYRADDEGTPPLSGPLMDVLAKAEEKLEKKGGKGDLTPLL